MIKYSLFFVLFAFLGFFSCLKESARDTTVQTIRVRTEREPAFLFPSKSMGNVETQINQYIFLQLANYHPESLELIPILITDIPQAVPVTEGKYEGTVKFDCRMRPEARWDDGSRITGHDYLFTIKLVKLDQLSINPAVRSIFAQLKGVEIDPVDPAHFAVYINKDFHLARELALIVDLIPEYRYDPDNLLRYYQLVNGDLVLTADAGINLTDSLQARFDSLNHADTGRKYITGSGPYFLDDWQTNQYVRLKKKQDYWGMQFRDHPYLDAHPEVIEFVVHKDPNTAITAFLEGGLDVLDDVTGVDFFRIRDDERFRDRFDFYTPPQLSFYFIGINQHDEILQDVRIRKAIAHLVDVDRFIENQEMGLGQRVPGPIVPAKKYFNDTLALIPFDIEKAKELIMQSGWEDSDGNGIADKFVNGEKKELSLEILITGKNLGKNLALGLKENAKKAGIWIEIITRESQLIRKDLAERNFDLYPTGVTYGPYNEDLYQSWHSDNDYPGGSNRYGFRNAEADKIIERLRTENEQDTIQHLFRRFQEISYEIQPCIFLYAPTNNIIVNRQWESKVTVIKPGYLLTQFKPAN